MEQDHLISNQAYNVLKPVVTIVMPAVATLYFALAQIWGLPNPEGVVATITALTTFLGVFLGISTTSWNNSEAKYDGTLTTTGNDPDTGIPDLQMTINKNPDVLAGKRTVRLKMSDQRTA
jgi:hypothetical protein